MLLQLDFLESIDILLPILSFFLMIFLMLIMLYLFLKYRIWYLILVIELFSLIIGINALGVEGIPFTPYFQILFLIFQTFIFFIACFEVINK